MEAHKHRVKLVLIGGRYSAQQRVRIKDRYRSRVPDIQFTEPGLDHIHDNAETKAAVKRILGL